MFRILALTALLAAGALAAPETAHATKAGFKGGIKPVPFRAHGLFRPVTPRTLSHTGRPAKFHGHHPKRVVQPAIVGLTGGGLALLYPAPLADTTPGQAIVRPALVPVGGLALLNPRPLADMPPDEAIVRPALVPVGGMPGCTTEDVAVTGKTISVIRC